MNLPHCSFPNAWLVPLGLSAALVCAPAHSQDAANKALNLLGSFLRQAPPSEVPTAAQPAPAGLLGNFLGAGLAPASGNPAVAHRMERLAASRSTATATPGTATGRAPAKK